MNYVYLLSIYHEHGSEAVKATLDRNKLHALLDSYDLSELRDGSREDYHAMLSELLRDDDEALARTDIGYCNLKGSQPHNLGEGWGGMQLHVVRLE